MAANDILYRKVGNLGNMKIEVIHIETPTDGTSIVTTLTRPLSAICNWTQDSTDTNSILRPSITNDSSDTTGKTFTYNLTGAAEALNVGFIFFGF